MIPKVKTCVDAVQNGVKAAVILDGRLHTNLSKYLLSMVLEHLLQK